MPLRALSLLLLCWAVLMCTGASCYAQEAMTGSVISEQTKLPVLNATLHNTRTGARTTTNALGRFSILSRQGDIVEVSAEGYQGTGVTIVATLADVPLVIRLKPLSISLDEYVVRPRWTPYQADSIRRYLDHERTLLYTPGGSLMSPVSALAELFSQKKKQRLRFQKDFYRAELDRFTDSRYTLDMVGAQTGLSGDSLALFMNRYPVPYDYARAATDVELKMWVRTNYRAWLKDGRPLAALPDSSLVR